jgi:acetamidase/formamidase
MDAHPRILGTANLIYAMDRHTPPAVEIDSGDTLAVQTLDART